MDNKRNLEKSSQKIKQEIFRKVENENDSLKNGRVNRSSSVIMTNQLNFIYQKKEVYCVKPAGNSKEDYENPDIPTKTIGDSIFTKPIMTKETRIRSVQSHEAMNSSNNYTNRKSPIRKK